MKLLVVSTSYPSENSKYRNGFVHSRVKKYIKEGYSVEVLSFDEKIEDTMKYNYESVPVSVVNKIGLAKYINNNDYDMILVHFALRKMMNIIMKNRVIEKKIIIWVHGYEALKWTRRIFNISTKKVNSLIIEIISNTRQLYFLHKLINKSEEKNLHFVFVSNWMKNITETDTKTNNKITNYSIIPNPIDTDIFKYDKKTKNQRLKLFNLRPYFGSKKYGNDITVEVIKELSKETFFEDLEFNLYGDGEKMEETLESISKFKNVNIHKGFLNHRQIKEVHDNNGVVLMPTRQDAQGVSMCEAICSGLVPIVSNNTAIPEFVNEDYGYLCNETNDFVNAIKELYFNPDIFINKSIKTQELSYRLGEKSVLNEELNLINSLIDFKFNK